MLKSFQSFIIDSHIGISLWCWCIWNILDTSSTYAKLSCPNPVTIYYTFIPFYDIITHTFDNSFYLVLLHWGSKLTSTFHNVFDITDNLVVIIYYAGLMNNYHWCTFLCLSNESYFVCKNGTLNNYHYSMSYLIDYFHGDSSRFPSI